MFSSVCAARACAPQARGGAARGARQDGAPRRDRGEDVREGQHRAAAAHPPGPGRGGGARCLSFFCFVFCDVATTELMRVWCMRCALLQRVHQVQGDVKRRLASCPGQAWVPSAATVHALVGMRVAAIDSITLLLKRVHCSPESDELRSPVCSVCNAAAMPCRHRVQHPCRPD
jgi:hypothetical protein